MPEQTIATKKCHRCKRELPVSCFNKSASAKDGMLGSCRECIKRRVLFLAENPLQPRILLTDDEIKARRKAKQANWYSRNKDYYKKRLDDPHIRLAVRVRTRVYNAIKRLVRSGSKSNPTAILIGCSMDELKQHLEQKFRDGMNWTNYGPVWHIDHIRPCSSFDLTKQSEQLACFNYKNLQPLLAEENLRKNDKYAH